MNHTNSPTRSFLRHTGIQRLVGHFLFFNTWLIGILPFDLEVVEATAWVLADVGVGSEKDRGEISLYHEYKFE